MTKLDTYLRSDGAPTARVLAALVGVSQPYITDLRQGKRRPSPAVAAAIEAATKGAVPADSWPSRHRASA